jgi:hypothetical protein
MPATNRIQGYYAAVSPSKLTPHCFRRGRNRFCHDRDARRQSVLIDLEPWAVVEAEPPTARPRTDEEITTGPFVRKWPPDTMGRRPLRTYSPHTTGRHRADPGGDRPVVLDPGRDGLPRHLRRTAVGVGVSIGSTVEPLSTSVLSAWLLGEALGLPQAIGGLFIVAGVITAMRARRLNDPVRQTTGRAQVRG